MRFIGLSYFYSKFIDELHVKMQALYELLHDNIELYWNNELETLFQQIETSITKDVTPTLPITNYLFFFYFFTVDSFLSGIGYVFFQVNDKKNWMFLLIISEIAHL